MRDDDLGGQHAEIPACEESGKHPKQRGLEFAALSLPNAIPIFPLDGVILVPGARLPLHIFEPRYREMVNDAIEGNGLLAMVMPHAGHSTQTDDEPPIHVVGGLGRIGHHRRNDDGTIDLVLEGLTRLRIVSELPKQKLYREVMAEPLHETQYGRLDEEEATRQLFDRLRGLSDEEKAAVQAAALRAAARCAAAAPCRAARRRSRRSSRSQKWTCATGRSSRCSIGSKGGGSGCSSGRGIRGNN